MSGLFAPDFRAFAPDFEFFAPDFIAFCVKTANPGSFGAWTGVRPLPPHQKRGLSPQKPTFLRRFAAFPTFFREKFIFISNQCLTQLFSVFLLSDLSPIFSRLYPLFSRPFRERRIAPSFFFRFPTTTNRLTFVRVFVTFRKKTRFRA